MFLWHVLLLRTLVDRYYSSLSIVALVLLYIYFAFVYVLLNPGTSLTQVLLQDLQSGSRVDTQVLGGSVVGGLMAPTT